MKKLRCLIVEDDDMHYQNLKKHIDYHPNLTFVTRCTDTNEIIPILEEAKANKQPIDIIFMDVDLDNDTNGMDFLVNYQGHQLLEDINVIITTVNRENTDGYRLQLESRKMKEIKDYIEKPIHYNRLALSIEKNLPVLDEVEPGVQITEDTSFFMLRFRSAKRDATLLTTLNWDDVLYISTDQTRKKYNVLERRVIPNEIKIFTVNEKEDEFVLTGTSLNQFYERVPSNFVRISNRAIINLDKIRYVTANFRFLYLDNLDGPIKVGDTYKDKLPEIFLNFKEDKI